MKKIVCFGEALIDFLQSGTRPSDRLDLPMFCQFPGGAPANAAVAVAKLGGNSAFLGQVGNDNFGIFLQEALDQYGVDTSALVRHPTAPTALAFVSLDQAGERSFSFYRDGTADLKFSVGDIAPGLFEDGGILHFCSNTLTDAKILRTTEEIIAVAMQAGQWISMDVNLRHNLWRGGKACAATVKRLAAQAHVVKLSLEEAEYLSADVPAYIQELLQGKARLVLVTNGGEPVTFHARAFAGEQSCPAVEAVDTTCGGDGFIGGFLYQLAKAQDFEAAAGDQVFVRRMVEFAVQCGAFTVARAGAFPALPENKDIKSLQQSLA